MDREKILSTVKQNRREKNICLIFPGLYQGNYYGAIDKEKLDLLGISVILNCGANKYETDRIYLRVDLEDSVDANLLKILPQVTAFIHEHLMKEEKVYVHCKGGFSRSPSVVIAYLIEYKKFTLEEALQFVKNRNPKTKPNFGFLAQLETYQEKISKNHRINLIN